MKIEVLLSSSEAPLDCIVSLVIYLYCAIKWSIHK